MKKNNNGAYVALSLLVVALCFFYSWRVILPEYKTNKESLNQLEKEIASARDKLDSLKTTQSSLNSLGDIVDKLLVSMPSSSDAPNLVTEIEAIATKHQTFIANIQVGDDQPGSTAVAASGKDANTVPVSFSVSGSFEMISQFISSIESDVRFMNIQTLSLGSGSDKSGVMSLSISINAYKRPQTSLSTNVRSSSSSAATGSQTSLGSTEAQP